MDCLLVIDSGYSHTTITPLCRGRPLHRAVRRLDFGGKHLTNLLKEVISVRHFDLHQDTKIVNDVKEDVCFVSQNFRRDLERTWKGSKNHPPPTTTSPENPDEMNTDNSTSRADAELRVEYILPDSHTHIRGFFRPFDSSPSAALQRRLVAKNPSASSEISMILGNERFTIPEILFHPGDTGSKQPGLPDVVLQSLSVLPPLIQATLLSNVLVTGGTANLPGMVERLQDELRSRVNSEWEVRVGKTDDPIKSAWLGGARMVGGWPGMVREYGVTREEWFEYGAGWTARRFIHGGGNTN
jgi:actin-related protein 6